jgi:hypothetical protein
MASLHPLDAEIRYLDNSGGWVTTRLRGVDGSRVVRGGPVRCFPTYKAVTIHVLPVLWRAAAATGADLCWRMSASFTLPVIQILPDGSYLSELRPPRRGDGPPIPVRVIEYSVLTTDEDGHQTSELFALATTLVDVERYPAIDLARLYHQRWQAETGIADLKTAIRGGPEVVLRSRTPAMVEQEFWAMLCVYQAIRELISYATPTGLDPGRISFKRAFEAARDSATRAALSPQAD